MDVEAWLKNYWNPVDPEELTLPAAAALVRFVTRYADHLAVFVASYRTANGEVELIALDFQTGRPQHSVYPIKPVERVGILFANKDAMPYVYMLRDDFPDTEHQMLAVEGMPRGICIDDRTWGEAQLTWTPAELVQRILSWFTRATRGELHDARQPIDPNFAGSPLSFILPRELLNDTGDRDLVAVHDLKHRTMLQVRPLESVQEDLQKLEPICLLTYRVSAENMRRMAFAPQNLGSLTDMLSERGIDLFTDLKERALRWLDEGEAATWRLGSRFAVIVEMPILAPDGQQRDGKDVRAFVTGQPVGDIAEAFGVALKSKESKVGYVRKVTADPVNDDDVRQIATQTADVHLLFDRQLATQIAGRQSEDERNVVLLGAGAIGSHIADCLAREGRFRWTIIDHDQLLPHNIARHTARDQDISKDKAEIVSSSISDIIDSCDEVARPIAGDVDTYGPEHEEIHRALEGADLIIDATASILAARFLSDHPSGARRASVFFNPAGSAGVLLAEPADRSITLRDLEAQYLGAAARHEDLANHLAEPHAEFAYTGACRAITNLIPESNVMALSGLVAAGLGKAADQDEGIIKVWDLQKDGSVKNHELVPEPVEQYRPGDWTVIIDSGLVGRISAMRAARLPGETGGVLFGLVDIPAKTVHLVEAGDAPPDSVETDVGFTRGRQGVQETIDQFKERTMGQVRYVGEWHSHPPKAAAQPSQTDLLQVDWLASLFDMDTLPALMLIAGDSQDFTIIFAGKATGGANA